jgi:subtilase family serine protease
MQPVSPDSQIEFEVFLPLKDEAALDLLLRAQQDQTSPLYRHWLTPAEFAARFGAAADSVERVKQALAARGLNVTATHPQGMHVVGRADAVSSTFSTPLVRVLDGAGRYRIKGSRALTLPAELANEGATVAAFSPVPARHVDSRVVPDVGVAGGDNRISATGSYWFTDLKQAYDFPTYQALTGRGTTIAIVMSSDYLDSDMEMYFGHEKLAPPHIERVPVLGGAPFSTNNGASYEVSLDIQQSGGMAPNATIRLYNIPDLSDNSVLTAYNQIVQENIADIVSSSFSGPEAGYLPSYNGGTDYTPILTQTYESIFKQGNAQGITFVSSSGDSGGLPIPSVDYFNSPPSPYARFVPGVEHPASSPSVTGVGGTNLVTAYIPGSLDSSYVGENAYGDPEIPYDPYGQGVTVSGGYWGSGGGVSQIFSRPRFQTLVPTHSHMRTVPDISLQEGGCPEGLAQLPCGTPRSSVVAAVGGQYVALIGTSASAPEFAGLLGVLEESFGGRVGNVNYLLYAEGAAQARDPFLQFFRDRQAGFNGYEYTQPVYNQVLGLGTPRAKNIMLRPELPSAGVPQTPSNP